MSKQVRHALSARYEIMGHELNSQPIAVDTIISVIDHQPIAMWEGDLWVLGRRFHKSARAGERTTIDLILPGALSF